MKKDEINLVVKNTFEKIDVLFQKIVIDFNSEDICEFRTEIRKLRAFFRLLDMEANEMNQIRITKKMKTFYGYIGIILNIRLHLENITSYCENSTEEVPVSYKRKLERELTYWKKNAKEFMDFHRNFSIDQEKITGVLPGRLRKLSVAKFVDQLVAEMQEILRPSNVDEALHSARRFLQDIIQNWKYIQTYYVTSSAGLYREEDIKSFIRILSAFRDKCIDITLVQTYYQESSDHDKIILEKIMHTWKIQKQELKQIIYDWFELIRPRPWRLISRRLLTSGRH